jgi:hypothetical protein
MSVQIKLTKAQTEKIESEWITQKPLLLSCVERKFGELNYALIRQENNARRENEIHKHRSKTESQENLGFSISTVIKTFILQNKFFSNGNKGTQNTVLLKRAERTVKLKVAALRRANLKHGFDGSSAPLDGHDFEYWVAENLKLFGWDATVTVGAGDQGVDVLARWAGKKLAIQCKRYQGSVGNKAVQEAYAGGIHYRADAAAVITNAAYTRSAISLAKSTGVMLCHIESIPTISGLLMDHLSRDTRRKR